MSENEENVLPKHVAIVIEFVGPPGAGKTTSCRHFCDELQDRGIKVFVLQDIKNYIRDLTYLARFYLFLETLFLKSRTLAHYTGSLAQANIYSINSIYRYFRLLVFDSVLKKVLQSKDIDVVLLDQWVIQELWSATIFKRGSFAKLSDRLKRYYFDTDYVFYFDIDLATASERISKRNTNLSRFDRMDTAKRLQELAKYNPYLFQLFEQSECPKKYIFSTELLPCQNTELFLQRLELLTQNKS